MLEQNKIENVNDYEMSVPLKSLRKMVSKFEDLDDDTDISFTLIMVALFPEAYDKIKLYGTKCYMDGYMKGLKENSNED